MADGASDQAPSAATSEEEAGEEDLAIITPSSKRGRAVAAADGPGGGPGAYQRPVFNHESVLPVRASLAGMPASAVHRAPGQGAAPQHCRCKRRSSAQNARLCLSRDLMRVLCRGLQMAMVRHCADGRSDVMLPASMWARFRTATFLTCLLDGCEPPAPEHLTSSSALPGGKAKPCFRSACLPFDRTAKPTYFA